MMKNVRVRNIAFSLAALTLAASASASTLFGPKGDFSSLLSRLEYDPSSACYKPTRPFSDDNFAWNNYRSSARSYLNCLESAAEADMRYAQAVVQEGYDDAVSEFLNELERGY